MRRLVLCFFIERKQFVGSFATLRMTNSCLFEILRKTRHFDFVSV